MGRPQAEIDMEALVDMAARGFSPQEMSTELGVSVPTLNNRIRKLQDEQGVILQYRAVRNLHLTQLQAKCLESITPGKIAAASLRDLVVAFKVLHDAEIDTKEDGGKVSGLVSYLMQIEKEEINARTGITETTKIIAMAKETGDGNGSEEDSIMRALKDMLN